jgi:hypothetical protein
MQFEKSQKKKKVGNWRASKNRCWWTGYVVKTKQNKKKK